MKLLLSLLAFTALDCLADDPSIRGIVLDPSGAAVVGASVELNGVAESVTSPAGTFEFRVAEAGNYTLQVKQPGFTPARRTVRVSRERSTESLRIVLTLATVHENVEISSKDSETDVGLDAAHGAGTLVLTEHQLRALPDDPDALSEQLQVLTATSGGTPGQAVVTVDGFLNSGRLPPKSAIAQVRINPDLYSAEYNQPPYEGGRIEIRTKPGAEAFHGMGALFWNDSLLNARNGFAPVRPPSESTRWAFDLGGPIRKGKSGFFVGLEKRDNDFFSVINAVSLDGAHRASLPAPQRLWTGTMRGDWQINAANSLTMGVDFNRDHIQNAGAGGFVLPESAHDSLARQYRVRLTETATLGTRAVLDSRLALTWDRVRQTPVSTTPAISIPGALQAGGSVAGNLDQRIASIEYGSTMIVSAKAHTVKAGVEIFRFATEETTFNNFSGTFTFGGQQLPSGMYLSGIDQYRAVLASLPGVKPTSYTVTTGVPRFTATQWQGDLFAQDDWKINPKLSLSLGLRYEMQTLPMERGSMAPRLGVAYAFDAKHRWVARLRTGFFYTRISNATALEVGRLSEQTQFLVYAPSFLSASEPSRIPPETLIPSRDREGAVAANRNFQAGIEVPRAWQSQVALEHPLGRGWTATANYSWTTASSLLRTRNINAPLVAPGGDPLEAPRPFGPGHNLLELQSNGRFGGPVFFAGVNQQGRKLYSLFVGYVYQDFHTNADTPFLQPQSSYSDSGEWAFPFWQSKYRVFGFGSLKLPWKISLNAMVNVTSGRPFNITTGRDNNGDGSFNDRPALVALGPEAIVTRSILTKFGALDVNAIDGSLPRNLGTNPVTATLDSELSRSFTVHSSSPDRKQTVVASVRATNLLNHMNVTGLNGVLLSPFFGQPNSAGPPRRIELGVRFVF